MKKLFVMGITSAICGLASAGLLIEMDFNDTNGVSSVVNRGSISATGAFVGGGVYSTVNAPVNGGGSSGSFNNGSLSSLSMGDLSGLNSLQSFTMSGWINLAATPTGAPDHLISNLDTTDGFRLSMGADRVLDLRLDGTGLVTGGVIPLNEWTFFALTYDGTKTASNVITYTGTTSDNIAQRSVGSLNKGATGITSENLYIGGTTANNTQIFGLMDNVRIHGSTTDASGVLSRGDLRIVMDTADVVPEPATIGMLGLGALVTLLIRRVRTR